MRLFNQAACLKSKLVESSSQTSTQYFDNRLRTECFVTCLISLMQMTAMLDCFTEMQITHLPSWVLHRTLALMQKIHTYRRAEWRPYGDWSLWHSAGFSVARDFLYLPGDSLSVTLSLSPPMPTRLWVEVERHLRSGAPSRMTNWQLRVTEGSGVILLNGSHGDEQQKTRIHLHVMYTLCLTHLCAQIHTLNIPNDIW